jgi:hypothetical protein
MTGLHKEQKYLANVKGVYISTVGTAMTRAFYIKYCKIVNNVIKEAKKQHYSRLIVKSDNKIKTTWNIIKKETGKVHLNEQTPSLFTDDAKV